MQYEHIFFDLDHTLWDTDKNSHQTISELFIKHNLQQKGIDSLDEFIKKYTFIINRMWDEYRNGVINKHALRYNRFEETFSKFDINDRSLAESFSDDFANIAPYKTNLLPHANEVLDYLHSKYSLHIITNGFEEVQHIKIKYSGLEKYFLNTITSEAAGYKKPDVRIFQYSLELTNANSRNSLMIGDNLEADIIGARNAGMSQLFYNHQNEKHSEEITFEIKSLKEIFDLL